MAAQQRTIVIGADHGGYAMKEELKEFMKTLDVNVVDGEFENFPFTCPHLPLRLGLG